MAEENKTQEPKFKSIFEVINQNLVDLSFDLVKLYGMVEKIHSALFQQVPENGKSEPNADGAETINE